MHKDIYEKIDNFFIEAQKWNDILEPVRKLLLENELKETFKWNFPTYTLENNNVVSLGAFKNHCAIWFFQGALLKDPENLLSNAQEGKTQAMRQYKIQKSTDLNLDLLQNLIGQAIKNQKQGKKVEVKRKSIPPQIPDQLKDELNKNTALQIAFENLSQGKRKEYCEYIDEAKQEKTRSNRMNKIIPMILEGKGLNDRYKK